MTDSKALFLPPTLPLGPMSDPAVIVLIPARLAATRLPGKPLADIGGTPMIVHVWRRAVEAGIGRVAVATDSPEIAAVVEAAGGEAVMTRPDHLNGTARISEALAAIGGSEDIVVNFQGDIPTVDPATVRAVLRPLAEPAVDIATIAAAIVRDEERTDPNIVKVVGTPAGRDLMRALYFTRATAPWGEGPLYHHIGLYAFRRAALARYVAPAAFAAGTAREARAVARARGRHAHRCCRR